MGRKRKTEEVQGAEEPVEVNTDFKNAGDVEVKDEILKKPDARTNSEKNMRLKKEKWKYKTRKKRKKQDHVDLQKGVIEALSGNADQYVPLSVLRVQRKSKGGEEGGSRDEGSSRTSREEDSGRASREDESTSRGSREESCAENGMDFHLKAIKRKYQKMSLKTRDTPYGRKIFNQISKLDSGGNSENHSSSEEIKKRRASWRDQTEECDVCGKEMLKTRLKKHLRVAHKSQKLYPCDECSFNAPNITELKVHLRKKHKLSMATVLKMVKFMKANKKHRRSIIDDEDEVPRPMNKRIIGLNSTIKDELHQTSSEAESKTKYIDLGIGEDFGSNSKDISEDEIEEDIVEREHKTDEIKDEFKDSGLDSLPTSQDEEEGPMSADEMLAKTRKLSAEDLPLPGQHTHSPAQVAIMRAYFAKEPRPSKEQEEAMSEILCMDRMKIRWWFQKERKKVEEKMNRLNLVSKNDGPGFAEERKTRERKIGTVSYNEKAMKDRSNLGNQIVLEYSEEDIQLSETPFDDIVEGGGPVCIGVDFNPQNNQCLLCNWSCSFRGNLLKHLRLHGFEPKCCTLGRSLSNLAPETRGCRKTFTQETFNLHICDNNAPAHFRGAFSKYVQPVQSGGGGGGTVARTLEWDSSDEEDTEDQQESLTAVISQLKGKGKGVCVGYEESETSNQCLFCDYSTKGRTNLFTHIKRHYDRETKFCGVSVCGPRENSTLKDNSRGCRKVFLASTFDQHTCTEEIPKPLGSFPLRGPGGANKSKKKVAKKAQGVGGGFRGYEKNFGVPDGSPAKFYSDRYRRVFSQLGVKDSSVMGSLLKCELDFLTAGQMEAVRDYVEEPGERFFLVSAYMQKARSRGIDRGMS